MPGSVLRSISCVHSYMYLIKAGMLSGTKKNAEDENEVDLQ